MPTSQPDLENSTLRFFLSGYVVSKLTIKANWHTWYHKHMVSESTLPSKLTGPAGQMLDAFPGLCARYQVNSFIRQ